MASESDRLIRVHVLVLGALLILALGALGARMGARPPAPDEWDRLVAIGDRLAAGQRPLAPAKPGDPVTARAAYLLAFHEAQDREDVSRMLLVARRLDELRETALAAHVREATRWVARERAGADYSSPAEAATGPRPLVDAR